MKRKFTLLIAALALLTMIVQPGRAWGQTKGDVTYTFSDHYSSNTVLDETAISLDASIQATFNKREGGTATQYYTNGSAVRWYGGGTLLIEAKVGSNATISNISITYTQNANTVSTDVGSYSLSNSVGTWTGSASAILFTQSGTTGHCRISAIAVTYTSGGSTTTPTTVTIDATGITNTDVYTSPVAGSLSATVTPEGGSALVNPTITWSSSKTNVATIDEDGAVTLVAAGTTTITASYAGESGVYAPSSATYELTVTSSAPQQTEFDINLNNSLFGTNYSGSVSNITDDNPIIGTQDNVTVTYAGGGNHYVNDSQIRFYPSNKLTFEAPNGYEIKKIVFTSAGTWAATISANVGTYTSSTKTWTGSATSVLFTGSGSSRCDMSKASITISAISNLLTVTYDANGATSGTVPTDSNEYEDGDEVTVLENTGNLAKAGYIWSGWNTNAEGTGTDRAAGSTFNISENTTLYAKWVAKSITGLSYEGTPTKTEYYSGENFDPTGLTVTATFNDDSSEDVTVLVVWTPSPLTTGTTAVTGTYQGQTINVSGLTVTDAPGTQNNPYTVAQAIANTPSSGNVYIQGIVSAFYNTSIVGDGSNYRYYISDDGTTTTQLLVYKGKGLNQATFTNANDLLVGDEVVIYGSLITYQNAPEIASGNYLYSWNRPAVNVEAPTFSPAAGTYANAQTVSISCETDGATIYYTTDGTEPTNESTEYTEELNVTTTTTFKAIAIKGNDVSTVTTATYHINSQANPYTVAQALAFYEYPANSIYVHGIVSTAPTQAPTNNGELTYYISVDGEAENELEVYKGKGLEQAAFTAQDDIQVGDIVTIYGNVQVYNTVIEFGSGNYLVSFYREPVLATEDVDIACDATEGVITYTVTNPASDGNLTAEITDGNEGNWLTLGTIGSDIPFTCLANNTTTARTATVTLTYKYNNATETKTATAVVTQAAYVVPTASIVVTPTEVNATAAETEDYLGIDYTALTITESDDFGIQFYDSNNQELNGDDEPDWITAEATTQIGQEGYFVYYYISANTGAARMAYFKVWALDDNSTAVYSNLVTVTQAAGSTPSNQYVRINDLGSLTDGSKVIIAARYDKEHTNGYYAMPGETSGKPTGVAFISEISGGYEIIPTTITSSEDTYSWTVNVTNDGYTFTNANNQMIGWTSSTNFATGGNNTEWTITRETAEETAMVAEYTGFVITNIYTTTTTTTRAFAFNGEKFGPYGTSNMTSATYNFFLDFFVQGATPVVTPSISANDVSITYDAEEGEIVYTINNPVEGGVLTADTEAEWLILDDVDETVPFYCDANTETTARTATVTLTYTYNTNQTVTKDVTVTQAGVPAVMYTVNFTLDGGTFVPNNDFTSDIVEIEAGTYNLPSATKTGFTFAGWNNGINTYAANAEYTVSDNVEFTAQWTETPAGATYTLITDIDQIVSGKHYIIVGLDEGDAYGIGGQATNNRTGTSVTITSNQITAVGDAKELVINGPTDGKYTIYDAAEPGYLYAASNTKNYLKTQTALDDNGKWTISLTNMGVATITAQGANGRNLMRFNPNNGSPLFACYATNSTTGSLPYIYVKDNDTDYEYYGCELTYSGDYAIPADETITIGAGSVMEVTGNLTNTTTSNLIIKDGGQLIHTGDVQATLLKDYDAAPWPSSKGVDGWYTIASPVNGADVSVVTTTANYDFYKYDEAEYKWLNQKVAAHGITTFEQGVGYLYATSEDKQGSFAGTMKATNANIEKDLSYACTVASLKGFNLMGNPFTRNLTNGDVKLGDSYLTTYYVVEGGSELVARQIDTYPIKPGQGFMVQATAENQKLVFNPGSAKGHSANNGYISIAVGNESFNDMAYINVANGNTLRKMTLNADSPKVYVMNNNLDYAAARVEGLSGSMPVCFQTKNIGTYTITIQANELDVEYLHLIDNVLHEDIDMLLEPSYSFIASGHDYAARFTLVFKANANIDEIEVNDIFAYQNGSDIIVNGNGELQVFDVTGRMVMNTKINGIQTVNVPATGMYIFRMVGESVQTQKIVVR